MLAQNGWPADDNPSAIGVQPLIVAGVGFPGGVKSGDVATVLGYVAEQFHRRVEPVRKGECWGYAFRAIRGATTTSNHAAGCAIDVNAPAHPLGKAGTFNNTQVATIRAILAEVDNVVRWGGSYSTRRDEMHFEIVGDGSAVARVAARLRGGGAVPPSGATASLQIGAEGPEVTRLQRILTTRYPAYASFPVTGYFGPQTDAAVREYQRRAGLVVDGIVGTKTSLALGL